MYTEVTLQLYQQPIDDRVGLANGFFASLNNKNMPLFIGLQFIAQYGTITSIETTEHERRPRVYTHTLHSIEEDSWVTKITQRFIQGNFYFV